MPVVLPLASIGHFSKASPASKGNRIHEIASALALGTAHFLVLTSVFIVVTIMMGLQPLTFRPTLMVIYLGMLGEALDQKLKAK